MKMDKPINLLGMETTTDGLICYAAGLLFIVVGCLLIYTAPQPVVGSLIPTSEVGDDWTRTTVANQTMPTVIVTPAPTPFVSVTPMPTSLAELLREETMLPRGVVLELYTGSLLGVFGLLMIFAGELSTVNARARRLKRELLGLNGEKKEEGEKEEEEKDEEE
jgi:hypothetical protein